MRPATFYVYLIGMILILLVSGCTHGKIKDNPVATVLPSPTAALSKTPIPTPKFTAIPTEKITSNFTPIPSATETLSVPTLAYIGTSIPTGDKSITQDNLGHLALVSQWGYGAILGVAFTPDGSKFVAGSAFGLAIYQTQNSQSSPTWIPFDAPINYQGFAISDNGNYLLLRKGIGLDLYFDLTEGKLIKYPGEQKWNNPVTRESSWGEVLLNSPNGSKQLKSHAEVNPDFNDIEYTIREVYDIKSGHLLYKLPDETFYLRFNDRSKPEACDLYSTSMCGNAFSPAAFHPYEAAFSPTEDTITILYRAPNYSNSNRFSVLRVYDATNGALFELIGNFEKPIQTFSYHPDGTKLLIAYVDGSIHLWDIKKNRSIQDAWHFNDYINYAEFTSDGKYLILKRPDMLEIRLAKDGSLRSRFEAVAYALSPSDSNLIAIADPENNIKIRELDSGKSRLKIAAHDYKIFTVVYSPDGKFLATSGQDCKVKLWNAQTGEFIHYFEKTIANGYEGGPPLKETEEMRGNSRIFIYSMTFISGTNQLVGFGSWGTMVNWDVNSGATNYVVYSAPLDFYMGMMTVSPHYPESFNVDLDKNQFYIGESIYDLNTGNVLGKYQRPGEIPDGCSAQGVKSSDGTILFTRGDGVNEGKVCALDPVNFKLVETIEVIPEADYDLSVAGVALSDDSKSLIIATTMGSVYVYQIAH